MYEQLKRDAARGVGWAFISSTSVRILQVVTTLVLAKLLMPADFGLFALATLIVNAAAIFRDAGLAQSLVYQRGDRPIAANTAFILVLVTGFLLGGTLFAAAGLVARAFGEPAILGPVRVMAIALIPGAAANVHLALLDRNLRFRSRAVPEVSGALSYMLLSIGLALRGYGAWSLVIGWVASQVVSSVSAWLVSGWRPRLEFDREEARVIVGYGKHLMVASLVVFAFFQVDNAAIGKWLGVTALGFYNLAFTVCHLPATNLGHVVNRVMFPTYSKLRDDLPEMNRVYLRTIRYISVCAVPAAAAIFLLSDPIIRVFYGEKWIPAIPLFRVLSVYGLLRSIGCTGSAVFMSTGHPGMVRLVSTIQLLVVLPFIYTVALRFGALGIAVLFTAAYTVGLAYGIWKVRGILGTGARDYARAVSLPAAAVLPAGGLAWMTALSLGTSWQMIAATGAAFCLAYALAVHLFDRSAYREIAGLIGRPGRSAETA
mgnify:CR=1 FL=1